MFTKQKKIFKTKVKKSDIVTQVELTALGCFPIRTHPLSLNDKDVYIKFYLAEDDRIMINCEAVNDSSLSCW